MRNSSLRNAVLLVIILVVVLIRTVAPLLSGYEYLISFTGVGAVSIFCGSYFRKGFQGYAYPLISMLLSDFILSLVVHEGYFLYEGWYYVYGAFLLMAIASRYIVKNVSVSTVFLSSVVAVLIHWLVTDFGVWIGGSLYPKTLPGFWACLVTAIPFELNFFLGTIMYSSMMFGAFEMLKQRYSALKLQEAA